MQGCSRGRKHDILQIRDLWVRQNGSHVVLLTCCGLLVLHSMAGRQAGRLLQST